ncbi:MAG: hypothetical protein A2087_02960 [Spirochaetes bacterium GWD1_61_31]|nr:MAG: hypothetical protein A2Y37_14055 [Spirochaetes bacterium GWB1_60_80]OHD34735.1 MAG: hypothetical protein A2004_00200 [Spirochaetes bacterium GWC1_61_12]OHD38729.1 MAG: hypothetical protein A2087_02960 [Spirochaetes bacterium GWD1_61_31]OHD44474.1 MAG: hypothetical protein A2Y35_04895 [Spirochaetes bacterium GWE1_60_18]OHD59376.1 MAG: hypothetical protein A2Y32_08600 [Spirochaetes bacterium GWF1_60_12]HAP43124.1 hypothetical protein [Spirochaetaceae bacterium]
MKRRIGPLVVLVAIAVLLVALNPTMDDFKKYVENKARASVGASGVLGNVIGGLVGGLASAGAGAGFDRSNLFVASLYTSKLGDEVQQQYLGIAKLFLPLKSGNSRP